MGATNEWDWRTAGRRSSISCRCCSSCCCGRQQRGRWPPTPSSRWPAAASSLLASSKGCQGRCPPTLPPAAAAQAQARAARRCLLPPLLRAAWSVEALRRLLLPLLLSLAAMLPPRLRVEPPQGCCRSSRPRAARRPLPLPAPGAAGRPAHASLGQPPLLPAGMPCGRCAGAWLAGRAPHGAPRLPAGGGTGTVPPGPRAAGRQARRRCLQRAAGGTGAGSGVTGAARWVEHTSRGRKAA